MILSAPSHTARTLAACAGLTAMLMLTASCSSPTREYAVPTDLCGVKVAASALEPVLPPGEKVSLHPSDVGGNKRCRLHVDDESALSASIEPWEKDATAQDVARVALDVDPADTPSKDRRFLYSKKGAVGRVECPDANSSDQLLWATVRVTHDDATEAEMHKLIAAYADAVPTSGACSDRLK
ncbi:hypothetical protein OHS70_09780 [Streptomyces sp. NBC_00390]|uniref:hypothetical protein n=1 Tax=Streptomyces sp. NBC_00390 TaxID=2975736 RepID=UPI002E1A5005